MSTEGAKAVVRRNVELFQEFWRTGDGDLLDEVIAPDFVNHTPGLPADLAGLKAAMPAFRVAFPDLTIEPRDLVAEGDRVALRVTSRGTHRGTLMGVRPTGRPIAVTETHVYRVAGGRIVERWGVWDALGMMQQIGVMPAAGGPVGDAAVPGASPPTPPSAARRASVASGASKALVRRLVDDVISRGDLAALDALLAPDYAYHGPGMEIRGVDGMRGLFAGLRGAFPDWREEIGDLIAEGDRVAFRVTGTGTHRGEFMGVAATGKPVAIPGIDVVRVADGRIAEHWADFDRLGMLQQLGAIPAPA